MLLGDKTLKQIPWIQLSFEAFLVVLSVLLALALDSRHQSNINEDMAEQAIRNFRTEVQTNQAKVDRRLQYHQSLSDSLRGK